MRDVAEKKHEIYSLEAMWKRTNVLYSEGRLEQSLGFLGFGDRGCGGGG